MLATLLAAVIAAAPAAGAASLTPAAKLTPAALAAQPTIETRFLQHAKLTVGDRFGVTATITTDGPALVTGPLADSMGVFLLGDVKEKTQKHGTLHTSTYTLSLAAFAPGAHTLPAFKFLVGGAAHVDTLATDTASITIASVMPPTMKDVNGLAPAEQFPNYALWIIPLALLLLVALALFGRGLLRRIRRLKELAAPPLPPWEEALAALDAIPAEEWLSAGDLKRYYYALSEILKRYIERRFDFGALEQSTSELLASMRFHKTPMREQVALFFERSDLVKYAKAAPSREESETAMSDVRDFVLKTQPAEPTPAATPATGAVPAAGSA